MLIILPSPSLEVFFLSSLLKRSLSFKRVFNKGRGIFKRSIKWVVKRVIIDHNDTNDNEILFVEDFISYIFCIVCNVELVVDVGGFTNN